MYTRWLAIIGLLLGNDVAAQNLEAIHDASSAPPTTVLAKLNASQAVRLPQGYQFSLSVDLNNPGQQPSLPFKVWFRFTSVNGNDLPCHSLLSLSPRSECAIRADGLAAGQYLHITDQILLAATWYRGAGTFSAHIRPCQLDTEQRTRCPEYELNASDEQVLTIPLVLP